jgi:hypothetical protein
MPSSLVVYLSLALGNRVVATPLVLHSYAILAAGVIASVAAALLLRLRRGE